MDVLEKLSKGISQYIAAEGVIAAEDAEVVEYGVYILLSDTIQILILLTIALLFDILPYMLIFALFYGALRRYAGGAHASTHLKCVLIFTATAFIAVHGGLNFPARYGRYVSAFLAVFAVAVVFARAPAAHPNNPKSIKSLLRFKRISRLVVVTECAVILASCLAPAWASLYTNCAAFALLPPVRVKHDGKEGDTG